MAEPLEITVRITEEEIVNYGRLHHLVGEEAVADDVVAKLVEIGLNIRAEVFSVILRQLRNEELPQSIFLGAREPIKDREAALQKAHFFAGFLVNFDPVDIFTDFYLPYYEAGQHAQFHTEAEIKDFPDAEAGAEFELPPETTLAEIIAVRELRDNAKLAEVHSILFAELHIAMLMERKEEMLLESLKMAFHLSPEDIKNEEVIEALKKNLEDKYNERVQKELGITINDAGYQLACNQRLLRRLIEETALDTQKKEPITWLQMYDFWENFAPGARD